VKCFFEHIVVKVPTVFIDESRYKGVGGQAIITNVFFHPERHVRNYGIVASVPDSLSLEPLANNHTGIPLSWDYPVNSWKTTQDIQMEIQAGDKVYFHWNSLLPDNLDQSKWNKNFLFSKKEMVNGQEVEMHYFRVKYRSVFAAVRYEKTNQHSRDFEWWMEGDIKEVDTPSIGMDDKQMVKRHVFVDAAGFLHSYEKKVVMIGSYVLVEPDFETWEDISIPTPETLNGKPLIGADGQVVMKPKDQWMVYKSAPSEKYLQGWVKHTGSSLKGDRSFLKPGAYVFFQLHTNTPVPFEGKNYFRMLQRHIMCVDSSKFKKVA